MLSTILKDLNERTIAKDKAEFRKETINQGICPDCGNFLEAMNDDGDYDVDADGSASYVMIPYMYCKSCKSRKA